MAIRNVKRLGEFRGTLVLVGAGKMGSAMLDGWLARGLDPKKIIVIEPEPVKAVKALARRGVKLNPKDKVGVASAIVIAVKPQSAPEALPHLARYIDKATLVLSIMAGRTVGFFEKLLPAGTAIVRAMPNTPAAIGKVEWVPDEALMDAVTALSGAGPAYIFLLAECMTRAGVAAGLPPELATRLARETVAGSAELLHRSDLDAATLRQNVTSPGGTTAAALEVLMGPGGFDQLLTQAIAAATRRSRDLAG